MPVDIHGKQYFTVAERVASMLEDHTDWFIDTELVSADNERVVMKATISTLGAKIATGYAEEERGSSNINTTSALENAETSAVGRALAFAGYAGTEIASADEVANAIKQQHEKAMWVEWTAHTEAVERLHKELENIRDRLADNDFEAAREEWNAFSHDDQRVLWRATSKGGWFTPRERQQMKVWGNPEDQLKRGAGG